MSEAEKLLRQIEEQLDEMDLPTSDISINLDYDKGEDVTCGVCGDWNYYKTTYIVNDEALPYDDWNTKSRVTSEEELDHERMCRQCVGRFLQTGEISEPEHYD